jgi:predicted Fe-S protein YdhL (DUF1289 family)
MSKLTYSPCNGFCGINKNEVCNGCGRTMDQIVNWNRLTDDEKDEINKKLLEENEN